MKKFILFFLFTLSTSIFAQNINQAQSVKPLSDVNIVPEIAVLIKNHQPNKSLIYSKLKDYVPTPGDVYDFNFVSNNSSTANFKLILPDSYNLDLPGIGKYNAKGKNLFTLQEDIVRKMKYALPLSYATFNLSVPATFNVTVYGAVMVPGEKPVTTITSVLDALAISGGLKPGASYRNITLTHADGKSEIIDFDKYYKKGDASVNRALKYGDKIFVPMAETSVLVSGAVYFPGLFELTTEDTLLSTIQKGGDIKPSGVRDIFEVYRLNEQGAREILAINLDQAATFKLKNADVINIRVASENLTMITVDGAVFGKNISKDGSFVSPTVPMRIDIPYNKGISLLNVLDIVGGPTPYAVLNDAFILQKNSIEKVKVNVKDLWETRNLSLDVQLEPGDKVVIPIETLMVFVGGEVNRPNALTFNRGLSLMDYIMLAGGFTTSADRNKIFTVSNDGKMVKVDKDFIPTPGCTIYVEKNFAELSNEVFKDVMIYTGFISSLVATASSVISLSLSIRDWFRNN